MNPGPESGSPKPVVGDAARLVATLALATAGGATLNMLDVPLAWMLGAMGGTAVAALAGYSLKRSDILRSMMLAVLGVATGSAFRPEILESMVSWMPSLGILVVYSIAITIAGALVLRRLFGWNDATAYFSAVPGGLTDMLLAGIERGGDEPTLALVHTLRIMMTVLIIPLWFTLTGGIPDIARSTLSAGWGGLSLEGTAWLIAAGVVGLGFGKLSRLPAYVFIGPMVVSASIHLAGMTESRPPGDIVSAAQVVVGAAIGCRFVGVRLGAVGRTILVGAGYGTALIATGALVALLASPVAGESPITLWLAYAPGGLAEMVLMTLSLGLDPAFVSAHHLCRFTVVLLSARAVYRVFEALPRQR